MAWTFDGLHQAEKSGWIKNCYIADLSGGDTILAAHTDATKRIALDSITIYSGAAIGVTIGAGLTGAALTAVLLGVFSMAANSYVQLNFPRPLLVAANTALCADATGAGAVCIVAQGHYV